MISAISQVIQLIFVLPLRSLTIVILFIMVLPVTSMKPLVNYAGSCMTIPMRGEFMP